MRSNDSSLRPKPRLWLGARTPGLGGNDHHWVAKRGLGPRELIAIAALLSLPFHAVAAPSDAATVDLCEHRFVSKSWALALMCVSWHDIAPGILAGARDLYGAIRSPVRGNHTYDLYPDTWHAYFGAATLQENSCLRGYRDPQMLPKYPPGRLCVGGRTEGFNYIQAYYTDVPSFVMQHCTRKLAPALEAPIKETLFVNASEGDYTFKAPCESIARPLYTRARYHAIAWMVGLGAMVLLASCVYLVAVVAASASTTVVGAVVRFFFFLTACAFICVGQPLGYLVAKLRAIYVERELRKQNDFLKDVPVVREDRIPGFDEDWCVTLVTCTDHHTNRSISKLKVEFADTAHGGAIRTGYAPIPDTLTVAKTISPEAAMPGSVLIPVGKAPAGCVEIFRLEDGALKRAGMGVRLEKVLCTAAHVVDLLGSDGVISGDSRIPEKRYCLGNADWMRGQASTLDLAFLPLSEAAWAQAGVGKGPTPEYAHEHAMISLYGEDPNSGSMSYASGFSGRALAADKNAPRMVGVVTHDASTAPGFSGTPVYQKTHGATHVVGIHIAHSKGPGNPHGANLFVDIGVLLSIPEFVRKFLPARCMTRFHPAVRRESDQPKGRAHRFQYDDESSDREEDDTWLDHYEMHGILHGPHFGDDEMVYTTSKADRRHYKVRRLPQGKTWADDADDGDSYDDEWDDLVKDYGGLSREGGGEFEVEAAVIGLAPRVAFEAAPATNKGKGESSAPVAAGDPVPALLEPDFPVGSEAGTEKPSHNTSPSSDSGPSSLAPATLKGTSQLPPVPLQDQVAALESRIQVLAHVLKSLKSTDSHGQAPVSPPSAVPSKPSQPDGATVSLENSTLASSASRTTPTTNPRASMRRRKRAAKKKAKSSQPGPKREKDRKSTSSTPTAPSS